MGLAQQTPSKNTGFELMSIRHSINVKAKIDQLAAIENITPSSLTRRLINAGLKAEYGIEVYDNQVADHGNTPPLD